MTWWFGEGLRFTCLECGQCCRGAPGHVWVTDDEIEAMSSQCGTEESEFRSAYVRRCDARMSLREREDGDCMLLCPDTWRCRVYYARPRQCKQFPFWSSMLRSKEEWDAYAKICPGMNQGFFHPAEMLIKQMRQGDDDF